MYDVVMYHEYMYHVYVSCVYVCMELLMMTTYADDNDVD